MSLEDFKAYLDEYKKYSQNEHEKIEEMIKGLDKALNKHMDEERQFWGNAVRISVTIIGLIIGFAYFVYDNHSEGQRERDDRFVIHQEEDIRFKSRLQSGITGLSKDIDYIRRELDKK